MHKSQLAGFIIDCDGDDLEAAAEFWSAALGYERVPAGPGDDPDYAVFDTGADDLHVEVQRVR
ncbi:MAG: VOC family protein, partial [Pseudomonadota bacterium]